MVQWYSDLNSPAITFSLLSTKYVWPLTMVWHICNRLITLLTKCKTQNRWCCGFGVSIIRLFKWSNPVSPLQSTVMKPVNQKNFIKNTKKAAPRTDASGSLDGNLTVTLGRRIPDLWNRGNFLKKFLSLHDPKSCFCYLNCSTIIALTLWWPLYVVSYTSID